MNLSIVNSRAGVGIQAPAVTVEVHVAGGLPGLTIVGLPAAAVREAKDRVRSALQNSGFSLPPRRITVNLAPADLPKDGGRFDLAIAIGILCASGQLDVNLDGFEFLGELSLSGELRPVSGALPAVLAAKLAEHRLLLPSSNAAEATLAGYESVYQANHLLDVCSALKGTTPWQLLTTEIATNPHPAGHELDLAQVRGQAHAKRALEIAACGRHNMLFVGSPGSGKSMLAQRLPSILPRLSAAEALELASILSASGAGFDPATWRQPPFRSPHHSASAAALVGGGSKPKPGEISLAHHGVLFLDELPEFGRNVLEVLREPLETGRIQISRAQHQLVFPARFQLLAAMNPCPCGYLGEPNGQCRCTREQVERYQYRVSGPLLDRIDLHLHVPRIPAADMMQPTSQTADSSACVMQRVMDARRIQWLRNGKYNADLSARDLEQVCVLSSACRSLLETAAERMNLSGRGIHRVLKVARSVADLARETDLTVTHLAEALQLRQQPAM